MLLKCNNVIADFIVIIIGRDWQKLGRNCSPNVLCEAQDLKTPINHETPLWNMPALSALWYFWKFRFLRIYLIAWFLFDKNIDQDFICQMFVTFPELLHVVNLFIRTLWLVITFERSTILLQLSLKVSLPLAAWLWTSCFFPSVGLV